LREVIREDEGATYGVSTGVGVLKYPCEAYQFAVTYTTNPDRLDRMLEVTENTIDEIIAGEFDDVNVSKIRTNLERKRETDLKKNNFWLSSIYNRVYYGQDFNIVNDYQKMIAEIDKDYLIKAAKEYCEDQNNILIIQLPEAMKQ
jgi:zinc protease